MKPKVLVLIDWYLPGFKAGGPIRSCANVVELLKNQIEFSILTSAYDYREAEPYPNIEPNVWLQASGISVKYLSKNFLQQVRQTLKSEAWDCVWINGIWSPFFSIYPIVMAKRLGLKSVISSRGMFADEAMSIKSKKKMLTLKMLKYLGVYKKNTWHFTNVEELGQAKKYLPISDNSIIENVPQRVNFTAEQFAEKKPKHLKLLYLGRISEEKNTLFALQALSEINYPVSLTILGQANDEAYSAACRQLSKTLSWHHIEFLEPIKHEDALGLLPNYHFLLLPTKGENFGHAIFEALQHGLPVIISKHTPWRQLENANCGFDLELNLSDFKEKLQYCLELSEENHLIMRKAAVKYANSRIDFAELQRKYLDLFSN